MSEDRIESWAPGTKIFEKLRDLYCHPTVFYSHKMIAKELGVSKNSVTGAINRSGLHRHPNFADEAEKRRKAAQKAFDGKGQPPPERKPKQIPRVGMASTLPPLPSLQMPLPAPAPLHRHKK